MKWAALNWLSCGCSDFLPLDNGEVNLSTYCSQVSCER